jgi:hypothetical protein
VKIEGELKMVSGDGKFGLEINENGFALRRMSDRAIIVDASTFFQEEEITFGHRDFQVAHKRGKSRTDQAVLYDYYRLNLKPVRRN